MSRKGAVRGKRQDEKGQAMTDPVGNNEIPGTPEIAESRRRAFAEMDVVYRQAEKLTDRDLARLTAICIGRVAERGLLCEQCAVTVARVIGECDLWPKEP